MDLDNMQLPKVNKRKQESKSNQNLLEAAIRETIIKLEIEKNYEFESYEIDNVLLGMIKRNHESYLTAQFGFDKI